MTSQTSLSFRVPTPKPRNPMVAPCLHRKAGSHASNTRTQRRHAQAALRRELHQLHKPPSP